MKVIIVKDHEAMSREAAKFINEQIKSKPNSVLGLATGGTPERTYELLIDANKKHETDWSQIKTFNLDEYIGIPKDHPLSYHTYMHKNLFDKVNINKTNVNIPSGIGNAAENGAAYDKKIAEEGGIDLQLLGIGENAHIAFNEPGSKENEGTREVQLTPSTINANSRYFDSPDNVPKTAITMGIGSILKAKKILLIASGPKKAQAIRATVDGSVQELAPASFLQHHDDVTIIVDETAAKLLRQYRETALCGIDGMDCNN